MGRAEETVSIEHAPSLARLTEWLTQTYPALDGRLESVRFAVNEAFVNGESALSPGDVVAVIPPVAGG